jgi:hypothetical protein
MFQVFYLDVAYVAMAIHAHFMHMFQIFQMFPDLLILQVFYLDIACVAMAIRLYMHVCFYTYVASVCS